MRSNKKNCFLERLVYRISRALNWIGACSLAGLVLIMTVSSICRYVLRTPIGGSIELIEIMMSFTVFLGLGYVMTRDGHINFKLVVLRLSKKLQALIHSIMCFLGMSLFGLMTWRTVVRGIEVWQSGEMTGDLPIPLGPFILIAALGMGVICLVLLTQFLCSLPERIK